MAKKKSKLPAYVLKQFNKAMYKVGDKVIIKWLGQIKTGYVTKAYESNFGYSYLVEVTEKGLKGRMESTRYPCGIRIKQYETDYNVGLILHDRTQSGDWPQSQGIYEYSGSEKASQRNDSSSGGGNADTNKRKNAKSRKNRHSKQNNDESGSTRMHKSDTEAQSLNDAVQRQRDFLNGFVKK